MNTTINVSKPLLEEIHIPEDVKVAELKQEYSNTVIEPTIEAVENTGDLSWMTFLSDNQSKITQDNNTDITEVIRLLANTPNRNWYEPIETLSLYLKCLALNIDSELETDRELVEQLKDTKYFSYEKLRNMYSELRQTKENHDIVHKIEKSKSEVNLDLLFARYFFGEGTVYSQAVESFRWNTMPKRNQYIKFNCKIKTNGEISTEHVVARVKAKRLNSIDLTQELNSTDSSRESINTSYHVFDCEPLSYHHKIPEKIPELKLREANSDLTILPAIEKIIEISDENPLPL